MRIGLEFTLRTPGLDRLLARFQGQAQAACDYQAQKLATTAVGNAVKLGLVKTGGLVESIYWVSPTHTDGYEAAIGSMGTDSPRDAARAFPAPAIPPTPGAIAAVAARHGMPLNNGFTHNRTGNHVAAKPFWTPAREEARAEFAETCRSFILHGQPPGGAH